MSFTGDWDRRPVTAYTRRRRTGVARTEVHLSFFFRTIFYQKKSKRESPIERPAYTRVLRALVHTPV